MAMTDKSSVDQEQKKLEMMMNLVMDDDPKPNTTLDPAEFATFSSPARLEDDLAPPPDMVEGDEPLTDAERCNLYVSNISTDVTDDELRDLFKPFGVIVNSRIMVDIHSCKSRGFGFVQFASPHEAAKAVKAVDGSVHRSQTLMVRMASRKTRQPGNLTPKMFLRNVPAGVSEDELRRFCQSFGAVTSCAVRPDTQHGVVTDDSTGGVSQVAYVMFADLAVAKHAAQVLNNTKPWPSCTHPLLAKLLDSNAKRRDDSITSLGGMRSAPSSTTSMVRRAEDSRTSRASTSLTGTMPIQPVSGGIAPVYAHPGVAMPAIPGATYAHPHAAYSPMPYAQPSVAAPYATPPMHQVAGYQVVMQPTLQPIYAPLGGGPPPQPQMPGMSGMPGMPGMPGMTGMPGMQPMPGMPGMQPMPGMPGIAYPHYVMPSLSPQGSATQMAHMGNMSSQPGSVTSQHAASGSRSHAGGRAPKNPFA